MIRIPPLNIQNRELGKIRDSDALGWTCGSEEGEAWIDSVPSERTKKFYAKSLFIYHLATGLTTKQMLDLKRQDIEKTFIAERLLSKFCKTVFPLIQDDRGKSKRLFDIATHVKSFYAFFDLRLQGKHVWTCPHEAKDKGLITPRMFSDLKHGGTVKQIAIIDFLRSCPIREGSFRKGKVYLKLGNVENIVGSEGEEQVVYGLEALKYPYPEVKVPKALLKGEESQKYKTVKYQPTFIDKTAVESYLKYHESRIQKWLEKGWILGITETEIITPDKRIPILELPLFTSDWEIENKETNPLNPMSPSSIRRVFSVCGKRNKVELSPHRARDLWESEMESKRIDKNIINVMLAHAGKETSRLYSIHGDKELRGIAEEVSERIDIERKKEEERIRIDTSVDKFREVLKEKGFSEEQIRKVEGTFKATYDMFISQLISQMEITLREIPKGEEGKERGVQTKLVKKEEELKWY